MSSASKAGSGSFGIAQELIAWRLDSISRISGFWSYEGFYSGRSCLATIVSKGFDCL